MKKNILSTTLHGLMTYTLLNRFLFILVIGFFSLNASANPPLATNQQIEMYKNSRTCVVLETGSISYNLYISDAVKKYWKSTEYEFIDKQEFEKRRHDSKYSFLVLLKGVYDKDPGGISYSYISLVLGNEADDILTMPELSSIPIAYSDDNSMNYGYAIPAIIKFMQKHVKNLETKRFIILIKGLKYYNGSWNSEIKELLLNKETMAPDADSPDKIKVVYHHPFKLLTTTEIESELEANHPNTTFNFHVGPTQDTGSGKCFEMIFDEEGNLLYYNYRMITNANKDGFNLYDFKLIN